ncbi:hypothetical protein B9Z19DRAFT_1083976 [Tuber borchii]|uniref:Uncharacterized protein n=1 Tax=Tuber borchii TaxID=42251 RepID=A0A2T6ZSL5_TUBBO|nr:hypothetical protein B9Z19DRAFT_1083976 [Tuber borchii]
MGASIVPGKSTLSDAHPHNSFLLNLPNKLFGTVLYRHCLHWTRDQTGRATHWRGGTNPNPKSRATW